MEGYSICSRRWIDAWPWLIGWWNLILANTLKVPREEREYQTFGSNSFSQIYLQLVCSFPCLKFVICACRNDIQLRWGPCWVKNNIFVFKKHPHIFDRQSTTLSIRWLNWGWAIRDKLSSLSNFDHWCYRDYRHFCLRSLLESCFNQNHELIYG